MSGPAAMRLAWLAALPLLLAVAWAGRAAPQIDEWLRDQDWFTSAAPAADARYAGVIWRAGPVRLFTAAPPGNGVRLPAGRKAVVVRMQAEAAQPVYQLMGCRLSIVDAAGVIWPAEAQPSARMLQALAVDGDAAGACDGAAYSAAEGQPVVIDTLFLIPAEAPAPYGLRISTADGRPRSITMPLATAAAP